MFSSIRGRLWLSYAALIAVALCIVALVQIFFLVKNPYTYRQTALRVLAAQGLLTRDARALNKMDTIAEGLDVRVLEFGPAGEVIADTAPKAAPLPAPTLAGKARLVDIIQDKNGAAWIYASQRMANGHLLVVASPRPRLLPAPSVLRDELWRPMVQGGLVALGLALILAYLLAGWIARPLQGLVEAARRFSPARGSGRAAGLHEHSVARAEDLDATIEPDGPNEVRELILAFNEMVRRVSASQKSQRDFVANVSHELKTPLTSIEGFAQAIVDGTAATPEARRQAATVIQDEAARMHRMAVDLIDLARLDAGTANLQLAPVDVRGLLHGIEEAFRPIAEAAGVQLEVQEANEPLVMNGDADRLAHIFTNLLDNAIKFTPKGGRVSVSALRTNGELCVSVQDTGPGIPSEGLPRIFDRFYRGDVSRSGPKGHGSGLGLSIAREIAEAHGGRITVRSVLGQGAEFVVHLPPLEGSRVKRGAA